jgi:creatinine amidohydrolase
MNLRFDRLRSPEISALAQRGAVVLVPIGACEVHGRHLPVNTDTEIVHRACLDAAESVAGRIPIAVLPPVWCGYSVWVLKNWPGTITIKPKVLIDFMYEILRSLIDMGLTKILIVNGHGNNPGVLDVVVRSIGDDFKVFPGVVNVYSLWDRSFIQANRRSKEGGIGHAGEVETSLMLHLTDLTDMSVADTTDAMTSDLKSCPVDGATSRKKTLYLSTWYLENPTYGGAGDPSGARAEFGEKIHAGSVRELSQIIEEFYDAHSRLKVRKLNRKDTRF